MDRGWFTRVTGTLRFRVWLPYGTAAAGAAASTYVGSLQDQMSGPAMALPLVAASLVGLWGGTRATKALEAAANRRLEAERIPSAFAPGALHPAPPIVGAERRSVVAAVVDHLERGTWVLLEGSPGVGKTAVMRAVLAHPAIAARHGDRRVALDFDELDAATAPSIAVVRSLVGGETDRETAEHLGEASALVALDHFELFLTDVRRIDDAERLLGWVATSGANTTALISGQGRRSTEMPLPDRPHVVVEVPRPTSADAASLFVTVAPSAAGSPLVADLIDAIDGLPRAVVLVAHAVETSITGDPTGTQPAKRVLAQMTRRIRRGQLQDVEHSPRESVRDGDLEEAVRAVLGTHLVTDLLRQALVELAALPDGIPQDRLPQLLSVGDPDAPVLRLVNMAHRLGLVHPAPAGVAAERVVAFYIAGTEGRVAGSETKRAWCLDAATTLQAADDAAHRWADRNRRNLGAAIGGAWPGSGVVALAALRWPDLGLDEDVLVERAASCSVEAIKAALEGRPLPTTVATADDLGAALTHEVLASAVAATDWPSAAAALEALGRLYGWPDDRPGRPVRLHTMWRDRAERAGDREQVALASWGLNRAAFHLGAHDPTFAHPPAARHHHAIAAWRALGDLDPVGPSTLRTSVAVEIAVLAVTYGTAPSAPAPDGSSGAPLGDTALRWLTWAEANAAAGGDERGRAKALLARAQARAWRGWGHGGGAEHLAAAFEARRASDAAGDVEGRIEAGLLAALAIAFRSPAGDPHRTDEQVVADLVAEAEAEVRGPALRASIHEVRAATATRRWASVAGSTDSARAALHHHAEALRLSPDHDLRRRAAIHLHLADDAKDRGWVDADWPGGIGSFVVHHLSMALELSEGCGSVPQQAMSHERLASAAFDRGWLAAGDGRTIRTATLDHLSTAIASARAADDRRLLVRALKAAAAAALDRRWVDDHEPSVDLVVRRHLDAALEATPTDDPERPELHRKLAELLVRTTQGADDRAAVLWHCTRARQGFEAAGDEFGLGRIELVLGDAVRLGVVASDPELGGDPATEAYTRYRRALATFTVAGDRSQQALMHERLGQAVLAGAEVTDDDRTRPAIARSHFERSVEGFRERQRPFMVAYVLLRLGRLAQDDPDATLAELLEAERAFDEARAIARSLDATDDEALALLRLGQLAADDRHPLGQGPSAWTLAIDRLTEARALYLGPLRADATGRSAPFLRTLHDLLAGVLLDAGRAARVDGRFDASRHGSAPEAALYNLHQLVRLADELNLPASRADAAIELGLLARHQAAFDPAVDAGARTAAITHLERALSLYTTVATNATNLAIVRNELMGALLDGGRRDVGLRHFRSACERFTRLLALAVDLGRREPEADAALELGLLAHRHAVYDAVVHPDAATAAVTHLVQALDLFTVAVTNENNRGIAQRVLGEARAAVDRPG